jgi:hypothetical protein
MRREIIYTLETMNEDKISDFINRQTNEQLTYLQEMLTFTTIPTQNRWSVKISNSFSKRIN